MCLGRPSGASDDDCDAELRTFASFTLCPFAKHSTPAAEIDDGQLQSTVEGNPILPGETFMTGFTSYVYF